MVYTTATVQFCITDEVYNASSMEYIKHNRDLLEKGNNMETEAAAGDDIMVFYFAICDQKAMHD